jgi:hypothetical protein
MNGRLAGMGLVALVAGACGSPPPPSMPLPASLVASPAPSPTPSDIARVPLDVRVGGKIGCASFPYNCWATVSVLPADAEVRSGWQPPKSDPRWLPDYTIGYTTDHLSPTTVDRAPTLEPGAHLLVVSLLGSSDVPSFDPSGNEVRDIVARCSVPIDVDAGIERLSAVVTFVPADSGSVATCSIKVVAP